MNELYLALGAASGSAVTALGNWLLRRRQVGALAQRDETASRASEWQAILRSNQRLVTTLETAIAKRDTELTELRNRYDQCEGEHREAKRRIAALEDAVEELQRRVGRQDTEPGLPAED